VTASSAQILRVSSSAQSVPQCAPDLQVHDHDGHTLPQLVGGAGEKSGVHGVVGQIEATTVQSS
jgi:hypothetical protein